MFPAVRSVSRLRIGHEQCRLVGECLVGLGLLGGSGAWGFGRVGCLGEDGR